MSFEFIQRKFRQVSYNNRNNNEEVATFHINAVKHMRMAFDSNIGNHFPFPKQTLFYYAHVWDTCVVFSNVPVEFNDDEIIWDIKLRALLFGYSVKETSFVSSSLTLVDLKDSQCVFIVTISLVRFS